MNILPTVVERTPIVLGEVDPKHLVEYLQLPRVIIQHVHKQKLTCLQTRFDPPLSPTQ